MSDPRRSRPVWPPEPGIFLMRLAPKGWPVPARIIITEDGLWQAEIDGKLGLPNADPVIADVDRIWHSGEFCEQAEWNKANNLREWALVYEPSHAAANPKRPYNPRLLKPVFPKRTY